MRTSRIPSHPIDVLLVEDDPTLREVLRLLLEGEGYSCAEADNGCEAVEVARQCLPRVVLLDLMLPELDGLAAAQQLQDDPRTRTASIYCLTARSDAAARRAAHRLGCQAFLTKPFDLAELLDLVSVAVRP